MKNFSSLVIRHPGLNDINTSISYIYDDKNFLIKTIQYNQDQLDSYTIIKNDEKGNPIELQSYDKKDRPIGGLEKAIYLYDKNRYVDMFYSVNGDLISKNTRIFNFSIDYKFPTEGIIYNERGDISKDYINDDIYDYYTYKYDKLGNWVEFKKFHITLSNDGKEKKKLTNVYIRKIKYWKE